MLFSMICLRVFAASPKLREVYRGSPGAPEMGFGYELGVSGLIAGIAQELDLVSGESQAFLASLMDDF